MLFATLLAGLAHTLDATLSVATDRAGATLVVHASALASLLTFLRHDRFLSASPTGDGVALDPTVLAPANGALDATLATVDSALAGEGTTLVSTTTFCH